MQMYKVTDFASSYVRRIVDDELDELFGPLRAVLLDGPKGVGKTATATQRIRSMRRLDVAAQRAIVAADPAVIGHDTPPLLIDEWQRVPEVFDVVRRLIDDDPTSGPFLLTGSAPTTATHSGAGRIATMRMRPLTLCERLVPSPGISFRDLLAGTADLQGHSPLGLAAYTEEILAGGFPGLRQLDGRARTRQLDGYLDRIVDHDLPDLGFTSRRPAAITAWLRAYAAATSTTASWEKIRDAATSGVSDKPARSTTQPYIELLTALRILDPLPAWASSNNHLAALGGAPKHHLTDPALAARLLRLDASRLLHGDGPAGPVVRDGTYLGALFESLVVLSVRTYAQNCDAHASHLRTRGGRHEVDLIVETDAGILAIEAKLSSSIGERDVSHLLWLRDQLGEACIDTIVVHTGPEAYRRRDGVGVIPLGLLRR